MASGDVSPIVGCPQVLCAAVCPSRQSDGFHLHVNHATLVRRVYRQLPLPLARLQVCDRLGDAFCTTTSAVVTAAAGTAADTWRPPAEFDPRFIP
jgi:hypothetical protein